MKYINLEWKPLKICAVADHQAVLRNLKIENLRVPLDKKHQSSNISSVVLLPGGVAVAQKPLELLGMVRIHAGQPVQSGTSTCLHLLTLR